MSKHALLSASTSKQWLNCPPSARLQENFPNESNAYAAEGTFMHALCEYKLRHDYLNEPVEKPTNEEFYSEEVEQVTDVCYEFVVREIEKLHEPLILVEAKLNYSHIAPDGFGTGDLVLLGRDSGGHGVIHVIDYKFGRGVFVEADHNSQLMLYALGALAAYGYIGEISTVRMTILQPRLDNFGTFECTREELEAWGESIKPIARLAYEGAGEQKTGDWCKFCRAKTICRACVDEALRLVKEDFRPPDIVPLSELVESLPALVRVRSWIDSVWEYVNAEAIKGVPIAGYKLVEGASKRVFIDEDAVARTAIENGYSDIYEQKLIGITKFEKLMGKKKFQELLGKFVTKPRGKLTLVAENGG